MPSIHTTRRYIALYEFSNNISSCFSFAADVKKMVDDGWLKNAFNQYVSDMISVHRSLPDPRDEW